MTTTTNHNSTNCCTTSGANSDTVRSDDGSAALEQISDHETPADVAAIRSAGFNLLLDTGVPVTVDALIAATDVAADRVAEIFESVRARGRVEFDIEGRLVGIAGLSLTPSRHQLTVDGNTRWAWCALDAIGILGALEATGTVRSSDPHTGEAIEIAFNNGIPDADTHLFILGGFDDANVREDWCPRVNFFASLEAAKQWVAAHHLEGDVVAVSEIAPDAAEMWRPVVDLEAPQVC